MKPSARRTQNFLSKFPFWKFVVAICLLLVCVQNLRHTAHHYASLSPKFAGSSSTLQADEDCLGCRVSNWSKSFSASPSDQLPSPHFEICTSPLTQLSIEHSSQRPGPAFILSPFVIQIFDLQKNEMIFEPERLTLL